MDLMSLTAVELGKKIQAKEVTVEEAVKAARMIDEGIVQTDIYSENEVQKYKKEKFKNMIYEVVGGQRSI